DNVGNIMALAERWFGSEPFNDNLCVIAVGPGVALGQFVNGMIHRGAHGINPEIGHSKTGIGADRRCLCGASGCLVRVAGLAGIAERAVEAGLWQGDPISTYGACLEQLTQLARGGDGHATTLLDEAGTALGIALANHIASWDPSKLLLLAEDACWGEQVYPCMLAALRSALPAPARDLVEIDIRLAEPDLYTRGTLALALDHIFRAPELAVWEGLERVDHS
ncbi:MAG TPA: ROK family protein, partial [Novosphingobium sp.]|nr:ROK family protein [Novosphingobium sp.]